MCGAGFLPHDWDEEEEGTEVPVSPSRVHTPKYQETLPRLSPLSPSSQAFYSLPGEPQSGNQGPLQDILNPKYNEHVKLLEKA